MLTRYVKVFLYQPNVSLGFNREIFELPYISYALLPAFHCDVYNLRHENQIIVYNGTKP